MANYTLLRQIKPITSKLLLYLISVVEYENRIYQSKQEIAEYLGYTIRNVEIGLKQLTELNIIQKTPHPQDKRSFLLFLNPYQSWKGKKKSRDQYIAKNQTELLFPNEITPEKKGLIKPNKEFFKNK